MRVYIVGMPGSGKSTLGINLLPLLPHYELIDLDEQIVQSTGMRIADIFEQQGETAFRELEKAALTKTYGLDGNYIIATGGGAPCFYDNMQQMNENGVTVYLHVGIDDLVRRLAKASHRPLVNQMEKEDLKKGIVEKLEKREPFYKSSQIEIRDSETYTKQQMAQLVYTELNAKLEVDSKR